MAYKQVKIKEEYLTILKDKGISANQAISQYLKPIAPENLPDSGVPKGDQQVTPISYGESEEVLNYTIMTLSNIHNFLWKTQTVNGYKNPASYKINIKSQQILKQLKSESENFE